MGRFFNVILLTVMIIGAAATYDMKHKAENAADHVAALQSEIAREKTDITLLKAEWSMLTQPARLQETVERYADHFKLEAFETSQIASIDEIPLKPEAVDPVEDTIGRIASATPVLR